MKSYIVKLPAQACLLTPPDVAWAIKGDTLTAEPPNARLYVELESTEQARGKLFWEGDQPIEITVHRPFNGGLLDEAVEIFTALYWARWRGAQP